MKNIILPIGISFYTFQALSYIIDLYKKEIPVQKNLLNLALYISFFPQLIAGPIVKYADVQKQIVKRDLSTSKTSYGIKRFIYGLSKKVLLANTFASIVDQIFSGNINELNSSVVWFGAILYTLQIYYDFSGYSDMAIGLGKMFGFDFLENFNYPYISTSVQDFWQRWHISLSSWFKKYLYIPLGGNRKGNIRTYLNLLIVFFATGLWHGASFNFIFWGLYNGFFLIMEKLFLGKLLKNNKFKVINHFYLLLVIIIGWVIFRAAGLKNALALIKIMFIPQNGFITINSFLDTKLIIFLIIGILLCGPIQNVFIKLKSFLYSQEKSNLLETIILFSLLFVCIMMLVNNSYNPFIYFRF
jgi:alginate O-acetyltransferase complex protein AlgI